MVKQEGRRCLTMKKDKLNYRIHDPNSVEDTAKYLLKIYLISVQKKVLVQSVKNTKLMKLILQERMLQV